MSGEHSLTPTPPEWNGNPCYVFGKKKERKKKKKERKKERKNERRKKPTMFEFEHTNWLVLWCQRHVGAVLELCWSSTGAVFLRYWCPLFDYILYRFLAVVLQKFRTVPDKHTAPASLALEPLTGSTIAAHTLVPNPCWLHCGSHGGFLTWGYQAGFSITNHPFLGYPHVWKPPYGGSLANITWRPGSRSSSCFTLLSSLVSCKISCALRSTGPWPYRTWRWGSSEPFRNCGALWQTNIAIENGPLTVDLPIKHGDFP